MIVSPCQLAAAVVSFNQSVYKTTF